METLANEDAAEFFRSVFDYDPKTGIFTNKIKRNSNSVLGKVSGFKISTGYVVLNTKYKPFFAHRVAWLYVHGEWPTGNIDHINGKRDDNRIKNLRDVSERINVQNQRRPHKNNKTGYLGVSLCKKSGKYVANIGSNYKLINLGTFKTAKQAHLTYLEAKKLYHPEAPTIKRRKS